MDKKSQNCLRERFKDTAGKPIVKYCETHNTDLAMNKIMLLRILLIVLILLTPTIFAQTSLSEDNVSQNLAKWRAANYSDIRYKLNIAFQKDAPLMTGTTEIRVNLTEEGAKNDLILDWRSNEFQDEREKPYAIVHQVNKTLYLIGAIRVKNEQLAIPKEALKSGENFIRIQFASLIKASDMGIARFVDKEDSAEYIYSQFAASKASTAFPLFDQPDLKARFQLNIFAPIDWKVISNVQTPLFTVVDSKYDTSGLKIFEETKPISLYVFAFAAGEFAEFEDVEEATRLVKKAPAGSGITYEPYRNPNRSKVYVRKSQTEEFNANKKEFFRLNRVSNMSLAPKIDFVILPELAVVPNDFDGLRFMRESSVFK